MSAIPFDASEPVRFQPEATGPTYLLRVPRKRDRGGFWAAIAARGGVSWIDITLLHALEKAVGDYLPGDENYEVREARQGEIRGYRERVEAAREAYFADKSEENLALLTEAAALPDGVRAMQDVIRRSGHETYCGMLGDNISYRLKRGEVAVDKYLVGWEGDELPEFRRSPLGLPEDIYGEIPDHHVALIGDEIDRLFGKDARVMGNSRSASTGASSPTSSEDGSGTPGSSPETTTPSA